MNEMKILIVDDNKQVRQILREFLPASFDEIYECNDGSEAFPLYRLHHPDWVLMDWEMPKVNGITAIREIITEFPNANICMVTAFDDRDIRAASFSAGAKGFVPKNRLFELEAILETESEH